jgi:hypothetical protein
LLLRFRERGYQDAQEQRDDANDDKQLDKGESTSMRG